MAKVPPQDDFSIENPSQIPKDKEGPSLGRGRTSGHAAVNSGVLNLVCWINRRSPFMKSNAFNDVLIFNSSTFNTYPQLLKKQIETTPGLEGIYLKKQFQYRHNFIYAAKTPDKNALDAVALAKEKGITLELARKVVAATRIGTSTSADDELTDNLRTEPVYKEEQKWEIKNSVFSSNVLTPSSYSIAGNLQTEILQSDDLVLALGRSATPFVKNCRALPVWQYENINKEQQNADDTPENNILMPTQITSNTCSSFGVHWRLEKKTPLFKGEDFYIEFHKRSLTDIPRLNQLIAVASLDEDDLASVASLAEERGITLEEAAAVLAAGASAASAVTREEQRAAAQSAGAEAILAQAAAEKAAEELETADWLDKDYAVIDSRSKRRIFSKEFGDVFLPINLGVVDIDENANPTGASRYDFRDQAYYVIEVGKNHPEHNYLFLITQKGPIRCVRISNGQSFVVSDFEGAATDENQPGRGHIVTGKNLIEADWFRMTVRNHLGKLVVEFEGPGFSSVPWVITRKDPRPARETGGMSKDPTMMFIPRGKMTLWGGNMLSGFLFGPLQYHQSGKKSEDAISFTMPPKANPFDKNNSQTLFNSSNSVDGGLNPVVGKDNVEESLKDAHFGLPQNSALHVKLTATDHTVQDLGPEVEQQKNNTNKPNREEQRRTAQRNKQKKPNKKNDLFVQDAQAFVQVIDGKQRTTLGSFFKQPPLKEVQSNKSVRSKIEVKMVDQKADASNRTVQFRVEIKLRAGDHEFDSGWKLARCKTPVMTMMRLVAEPDDIPRWEPGGFECGEHVMMFNDSWSAQDFTNIEHKGQIKFLLNPTNYVNDRSEDLSRLRNRAFYIELWAGYTKLPDGDFSTIQEEESACNYSKLPRMFKLFTGICYGGNATYTYGSRTMDCQLFDYSKPLQDQLFFNSPFYDGVKDVNAIEEILSFAGLRALEPTHSRFVLKKLSSGSNSDLQVMIGPDGRKIMSHNYALPNNYKKLEQPFFKFNDGDSFFDGITKMAQRSGKVFFFDAHGVAHYENYLDLVVDALTENTRNQERGDTAVVLDPLFWFTTNNSIWPGQLVFNSMSIMEDVQSVYNHIRIFSNTPDFEVPTRDNLNWPSIDDPNSEGFIGYLKTVYQADGVFGSFEAMGEIIDFYKSMYRPPYVVKFETYGQPVRALDVVSLNGQKLRVMKVDSSFDPQKNAWWQTFECEWLKPIEKDPGPRRASQQRNTIG